jgi:DNA polymerase III delta prime subunit
MNQINLFVEKYRPKTVEECILPESIKKTFREIVKSGEPQNLLLAGKAGTGKTSVAKALCSDLDCDYIMINCSEDGNIDTLRNKIRTFASTVSLNERPKVVILDEFDYSNASSIQPALRGAIEEFAKNCRFILTCNYKNRIIEPIHSRCTVIEFSIPAKDKPKMAKEFMARSENILKAEKVEYDPKVLSELIIKFFPDFRRVLNELQRYSVSGKIDVGILADTKNQKITDLMGFMKSKDFSSARKWVAGNMDNSQIDLFRAIYDGLYENLSPSCIPQAILILAEYQYKAAFVADQEINTAACVVELMMSCEFK